MEKFALIVAGGAGTRMGAGIPKQFLDLAGKPVLMRTIERFVAYDNSLKIIVVLPHTEFERWNNLCTRHCFRQKYTLVEGGASRFLSVKNGLSGLPGEGLVFIHDGVRPLVSLQTIANCEKVAMEKGNALPVMPLSESLRQVEDDSNKSAERSKFRLVQTPQTFRVGLIKKAYDSVKDESFTDDASVLEACGGTINLVGGNAENIKITRPLDLIIADCLFRHTLKS